MEFRCKLQLLVVDFSIQAHLDMGQDFGVEQRSRGTAHCAPTVAMLLSSM